MPTPGRLWRHVVISTKGSWLHGDPRGFRSRGHRLHSSGDHHNPPPPEEHRGLLEHRKAKSAEPVVLPKSLRPAIGETMVQDLMDEGCRVLAMSVSGMHIHALAEMTADPSACRRIVGRCKGRASRMLSAAIPGAVWAAGGGLTPVRDEAHHRRTYRYILAHLDEDAWVWDFRDAESRA